MAFPLLNSLQSSVHLKTGCLTTTASPLRSSLIKHGARNRSPNGRKNVSFITQVEDKKVSNLKDCLKVMQQGTEFIKLRANVKQFRRKFTLDADLAHIRWTPTNKKPHKARIAIDSIKEIRVGRNTELLRSRENCISDMPDECAFSVIYGDDYDCLDLIARTPEEVNIWVAGLIALTSGQKIPDEVESPSGSLPLAKLRERWIESQFDEVDVEKKGFISEKAAIRLIRQMNKRLLQNRVSHKVKEAAVLKSSGTQNNEISKKQFVEIYKDLATRPEIYFLMVRYANKDYLSCNDLQIFLETEQGMVGVTRDLCESIIEQYEPSEEAKKSGYMTVDGFTNYLLCEECSVFDINRKQVYHEMNHPFSSYFISASYRTYLLEDQLKGPSSSNAYTSALKRSCRFIEMNVWEPNDAENETEPMIFHGGTTTRKIRLTEALYAIRSSAFETSRFPLFIRLFIHLNSEFQLVLATSLDSVLDTMLYRPKCDTTDWCNADRLPTPEEMQMKIILIGKRLENDNDESGEVTEEEDDPYIVPQQKTGQRKARKYVLRRELSDLICPWLKPTVCKDLPATFDDCVTTKCNLVTFAESNCLKILQNASAEFTQFSRDCLVRAIPNALRLDSSNMNPLEFWNYGVQFVSLNYQTPGLMMDLQEGKFSDNGGCGYILKPLLMRDEFYTPGDKLPLAPQILHLRILSGQQLPRPRGSNAKGDSADPFVVIEIFGVSADCAEERVNPCFDESFQFQISVPELALVRFLVLDDDFIGDDFIGQYTIPFECLQSGYRHISLSNNEGDRLENCTLFVHIAVTNRRGGGKPRRRGMSVKRKMQRVHTGMKMTGVKSVDDLFKFAVAPLSDSIDLRNKLEAAMIDWQEHCGLGPAGTIRQGLRLMHARTKTAAMNSSPPLSPSGRVYSPKLQGNLPSFQITSDEQNHPVICMYGEFPVHLQKTLVAFATLLRICTSILSKTDQLLTKLEDATKRISESYEELASLCISAGLRGLKAARASENFAWNVRLLKAQLTLMNKTQTEANDIFKQVFDAGRILGILSEKCSSQLGAKRYLHTSSC
uniref:Phosphoinositide phospholipase C n=1 Tax=Syphacia muris TaxID=451379 RepID=A0A158R526_9BILA